MIADEELRKYGFESLKEYHAFAYTDYCFKKFMEAAKESPYFNNTIFIFTGDHGVEGNADALFTPKPGQNSALVKSMFPYCFMHLPCLLHKKDQRLFRRLIFYQPVAGMMQQPYLNSTLGRDLLDANKKENAAFIIYHAPGWIGVVNDDYFYRKNIRIKKEELVPVRNNLPVLTIPQQDSVKKHLSQLTSAIYETARWMLDQ